MSIKFKPSQWIMAAVFTFGVCTAISADDTADPRLRKPAGYLAAGLAATGLIKATKSEEKS